MSIRETSAGKRKILALLSFNSDVYARILRPFTFPRSMREYAHERQCSENNKHNTVRHIQKVCIKENHERAKKRRISQAVQRETPLRYRFPFSLLVCVTACACLAERSDATCHRQAHAVVPQYKTKLKFGCLIIKYVL